MELFPIGCTLISSLHTDSSDAVNAVLVDVSRSLVKLDEKLLEAWKQAKFIEAVNSHSPFPIEKV